MSNLENDQTSDLGSERRLKPYSVEGSVAAALMGCLLLTVAVQVVGRLAGGIGPVWTEELSRWVWVWMAFIGAAEVERQRGSLRMEIVSGALPRKASTALDIVIDIAFVAILIHLIQIGWAMVERTATYSSVALPVPTAILYAAFPIGGILILIRLVLRIFNDGKTLFSGASGSDKS